MSARKVKPAPVPKNQYMQVFVRCRPLNEDELNHRNADVIDIPSQKEISIQDRGHSKVNRTFSFDRVFSSSAQQADVYDTVVAPLISDVLSGYNCTVFAYGQTGSGKTFTMEGDFGSAKMFSRDSKVGLIPRAMCALFDELRVLQSEYTVRISFLELYNEELYDLLSADEVPPKLRLFDDPTKKGSVVVQGLQEVMVHTQSQVMDELRKGSAKRQVAATLMNAHSSRSHTIFCVTVHSKENSVDGEELLRTGKLYLVDLAGSENIGRSGSVDKRAREAASINQSLLTLSRVTACLVERQPHIPYRESKLTRLLQDSFGGRTKTSMIATISPAQSNFEETLSTLDYAHRAKSVANKPEVNQKVAQNVIMKEYSDVIDNLKKKLDLYRNGSGIYVNDENYKQIVNQTKERNQIILDLISEIRTRHLKLRSIEDTFAALSAKLDSQKRNLENVNKTIASTSEAIDVANEDLEIATSEQNEAKTLLHSLHNQEVQVHAQAEKLTAIAEAAQKDSEKLHGRLDYSRVVLGENKVVLKNLAEKLKAHRSAVQKMYSSLGEGQKMLSKLTAVIDSYSVGSEKNASIFVEKIDSYQQRFRECSKQIQQILLCVKQEQEALGEKTCINLSASHKKFEEDLKLVEKVLKDACTEFHHLISLLPQQSRSLVDFVQKSLQNMNDVTEGQMLQLTQEINRGKVDFDKDVQIIRDLIHEFLVSEKEPKEKMLSFIKDTSETSAAIEGLALKMLDQGKAHKTEVLLHREHRSNKISTIADRISTNVTHMKDHHNEVSSHFESVHNTFQSCVKPHKSGVQDASGVMLKTISEARSIQLKTGEAWQNLKSYIHQSPFDEMFKEKCRKGSEIISTLNSGVDLSHNFVHTTNELSQTLSSKFSDMEEEKDSVLQESNDILSKITPDLHLNSSAAIEDLEEEQTLINDIVSSEISHDVPTGETPIRKPYGFTPSSFSVPSPVVQKVKPRIKKASWRRLLRSPRKPLSSTQSLGDFDEDGMASDSEVTVRKKGLQSFSLQKASSLCDLRSKKVFQQPRIPKKISRKVL